MLQAIIQDISAKDESMTHDVSEGAGEGALLAYPRSKQVEFYEFS
jgi:hypothetical protein